MIAARLDDPTDFEEWRRQARLLFRCGVPPDRVLWQAGDAGDLFAPLGEALPPEGDRRLAVPARFLLLARTAILHRNEDRLARLYRLLWRLADEPRLLAVTTDREVAALREMAKSVRRDIHKMRAFVRFRRRLIAGRDWHVAWFEPDHHIVEANAPFFVRRFTGMNWSILTPEASAHWDGEDLSFGPGARRSDAPAEDAMEDLWRGYYRAIFNPARLKTRAMRSGMAVKYWANLPEAADIRPLIAQAAARTGAMVNRPVPERDRVEQTGSEPDGPRQRGTKPPPNGLPR